MERIDPYTPLISGIGQNIWIHFPMDCYLIDSAFTRTNNIKAEAVGSTIELWNIILDYDDDEGVFQT